MSKFIGLYETFYDYKALKKIVSEKPTYVNIDFITVFRVEEELNDVPCLWLVVDNQAYTGVVSQEDFAKLLKGGKND